MMKKITFLVVLLLIQAFMVFATEHASDYLKIKKTGVLLICYTPWLGATTQKDYPSPHLEIALGFAEHLGLKAKVVKISWADQFKNQDGVVKRGESYIPHLFEKQTCDLFANNLGHFSWRKKLMNFNWIFDGSEVVIVKKENKKNYNEITDLYGKRTVTVPQTAYHQRILKMNKDLPTGSQINYTLVPKGGTLAYLLKGEADFVFLEATLALHSKLKNKKIDLAFSVGTHRKVGWGFPKSNPTLLKLSQDYLDNQKENRGSAANNVFLRYFGITLSTYTDLQFLITCCN